MISPETIEQVRQGTDIVAVVGAYVPLRRAGRYFRGLCPFHTERSASFYVSPDRQIYHCFGCGVGGNVFGFLMAYEKLSFPEAVQKLAEPLGIKLVTERIASRSDPVYDVCTWAARLFTEALHGPAGARARAYLERRQLSSATVQTFQLGYAPGGNFLLGAAARDHYSIELLTRAGLAAERDGAPHDWFWERLIFPIFSASGRVIAFGGRPLDDARTPKYLNSPETEVFRKGENLYGLFQCKSGLRAQGSFLVEGYFDLLSLYDRGITNVVAPLGTALTDSQARILRRYAPRVTVFFDGDASGIAAATRALRILLGGDLEVRVALLPRDVDPDALVVRQGADGLRRYAETAFDFGEFLVRTANPQTVEAKVALARAAVQLLAVVPDAIRFEVYLNRLAELLGISREAIRREAQRRVPGTPPAAVREHPAAARPGRRLLALALQADGRVPWLATTFKPEWFDAPPLVELARDLYARGTAPIATYLDEIDDEDRRRLVAGLGFEQEPVSDDDFRRYALRIARARRVDELRLALVQAERDQDEARVRSLQQELSELKKADLRPAGTERSSTREEPKVAG